MSDTSPAGSDEPQAIDVGGGLPYRPNVGIVVINAAGLIWLGRRIPKIHDPSLAALWQMPQGGIDEGEAPEPAAFRELEEETGIRSVSLIAESSGWLTYDLPPHLVGRALKGRYRGQRQKWFAMRFEGDDTEVDIGDKPHEKAEFDAWRWAHADALPDLIVPFKRDVYTRVLEEFSPHLA